METDVTNMNT